MGPLGAPRRWVTSELTGPAAGFDGTPGVADPADITGYDVGKAIGYDRSYRYDPAGRLTTVIDHTASWHGADLDASPCQVRTYTFDSRGRRTSLATATHTDGACDGTTNVTSTTASFDYYDTADRPTRGRDGTGQYVYDALGRQTTIPAADTPAAAGENTTAGDITLGYFDDDLPRSVTQTVAGQQTSTVFTLDSAGRRSSATTTTGSGTSTLVRHYTDSSDNPAWTDQDGTITRYAASIGGDLGAAIGADGSTRLTLANLHGDIVTTVPIGAAATTADAATSIDGWSDYTEYGTPRTGSTTALTGGAVGYGWLGAKQRSTSTDTAGLTLMGVRLYNPTRGLFTAVDPVVGGSASAYAYPYDPINQFDLNGQWWSLRKVLKYAAIGAGIAGGIACGLSVVCGVAVGATAAASVYAAQHAGTRSWSWSRFGGAAAIGGITGGLSRVSALRSLASRAPGLGRSSRLFGNSSLGSRAGMLNTKAVVPRIGWSVRPYHGTYSRNFRIYHPRIPFNRGHLHLFWGGRL